MTSPRRTSAIYEADLARFGGPTQSEESTTQIQTSNTELIGPNPDRVQYWITNNGPDTIYWSTVPAPSATRGHILGAGSTLVVRVYDDGEFVGRRLYATVPVNATNVTITEVVRVHRGG